MIERDPIAITSKISSSIHGKSMSKFLYENIDVFSSQDLTVIKEKCKLNGLDFI